MRINKFLSECGVCSRRQADAIIESGQVNINRTVARLGDQVSDNDRVFYKGKEVKRKAEKIFIALNKPVGIECTTNRDIKNNIIDFLKYKERVFPVGRLDKNSEGLILLTNDGDTANNILKASNYHEKEYIVEVNKPITNDFIKSMSSGVEILDTITRECEVTKISKHSFKIILTQGLNRQIRRMCEALGYEVLTLKRVRILNIKLEDLRIGKWRMLKDYEVKELNQRLKS